MKACFPVAHDRGLESRVYPHLGSAPWFLLVDTETRATLAIANPGRGSAHGRCHPLDVIADEKLDLLVVSGMGAGAVDRLRAAGVRVYHTARATVGEALDAIGRGALPPVVPGDALAGGPGRRGGRGHAHHGQRGGGHGAHHGCRGGCGA